MLSVNHLDITVDTFTLRDISFSVETGDYFVLLGDGVGKTSLPESLAGLVSTTGEASLGGTGIVLSAIQQRATLSIRPALFYLTVPVHPSMNGAHRRNLPGTHRCCTDILQRKSVDHCYTDIPTLARRRSTAGGHWRVRGRQTLGACCWTKPLASLDSHARIALRALLRKLNRAGQTVIHVTHDYEEALSLATHIGVMEEGTIVQTGTPSQVFQHPVSEFVARFIGIRNVFPGTLAATEPPQQDTALFTSNAMRFRVLTDAAPSEGLMLVRSEDVTLSLEQPSSSAQNSYRRSILRQHESALRLVWTSAAITALVTSDSVQRWHCTGNVWPF